MSAKPIDCVIVGHNDVAVDQLIVQAAQYKEHSGTYRHLLANTVELDGTRVKYPALFNRAIAAATGRPANYNVAKLPNLGACTLASFLRKRGYVAEIVNFFNDDQALFADLLEGRPRCVAITTTYYYDAVPIREIVEFVRRRSPSTKIVVGGPHIFNLCSDLDERSQDIAFAEIGADVYVFDSQGELTLSRICEQMQAPRPNLDVVPNLTYTFDQKAFYRTRREIEDNDMDANVVDWSSFPKEFITPVVQMRTARSCAFKCSFCRYPVVAGPLNLNSVEAVERDLRYLKSAGTTHLLIIDDTFNIPPKRFKELCRMMIDNQFGFTWFSYFRCANADDEAFDLLAEAGCKGVFLGIESADPRILQIMSKGATPERYAEGIRKLKERGIITYASFIVGFPGETEESARNTIEFIRETQPAYYSLETFFYDRKTPIHARAAEFGLKGSGYSWRHQTMDWRRASQIVEDGYRTIAESVILPLHGFDLWSIGYLMAHGFAEEQLREFMTVASRAVVSGLDGGGVDPSTFLALAAATEEITEVHL
jgi:p-methyltransferase